MAPNPPEMVQLDRSDYVFDEHGGRGTPATTFFKRLASYRDHRDQRDNSLTLLQDDEDENDTESKIRGSAFSHADALSETLRKERQSTQSPGAPESPKRDSPRPGLHFHRKKSYFDGDDDWDANVEHDLVMNESIAKSIEHRPHTGASPKPSLERQTSQLSNMSSASSKELYSHGSVGGVKDQVEDIIRDPASSLYSSSHNIRPEDAQTAAEVEELNSRLSRINKFKKILQATNVDLEQLRKLAWSGVPQELRPISWQLLLGYLPTNSDRRVTTLARKRQEYMDGVEQVFSSGLDQAMWHQISIDVPRTNPHIKLYGYPTTQRALERILYLWAIRHPASGYVQGINDLVTPFFQTFLSAYIDGDPETFDPGLLPKKVLDVVEADSYWCLTKLLDGIQDNYIHAQPGIHRQVAELRDLTQRIDGTLVKHLQHENVEFMQFSFRWMNCLLMREISVKNTIRMWDTYLAEGANGFSHFHVYVCAAFLVKWSSKLVHMEFQEIMMFLQALPTKNWTEKDMELLLSEAYMWQSLFKNASAHLR
uniref:ARAD1C17578p n=1 Tax=Blastobotrys adeninivorans TaxID=409370 RepID=A0A060T6Z5_BLAAD